MLGITDKSARVLMHRIREALRSRDLSPMGGEGATVDVDETCIGMNGGATKRWGCAPKHAVQSEQSARFIETAPERGCDESPDAFEAAVQTVARHEPVEEKRGGGHGPKG